MPSERPAITRLVDADKIAPSTYNPRQVDPARLEIVKLSLQKLGWLLPIYADANGEILSGHQRHYVATEMLGMEQVPVCYTRAFELEDRKALNIVFNRGTNDMDDSTLTSELRDQLTSGEILTMAKGMPDAVNRYPILTAHDEPIAPLLAANKGRWSRHARNVARILALRGVVMPILVDEHDVVINGIGRLEYFATKKIETVSVIRLHGDVAVLARNMLNLLTMDFDLHNRYRDELRYNSFRRTAHVRRTLGQGFTFAVIGSRPAESLKLDNPTHVNAWKRVHGTSVVDFGAGHLTETKLLRKMGVDCTPFEPFRCDPNNADTVMREESAELAKVFLAQVAAGKHWDSVFISSVLNSVPFLEDRRHIVTLLAAITGTGKCYAFAKSVGHASWRRASGQASTNFRDEGTASFAIGYEPGTTMTDFGDQPKAQKYHTVAELRELFSEVFEDVHAAHGNSAVQIIAASPRPIQPQRLRAAAEFEFDLLYPDGKRLGLGQVAAAAFLRRHGLQP